MRTPESVTRLLFDLYMSHEWEELEEYFIVAEQLVLLHMGHFRILSDIIRIEQKFGYACLDFLKYSDSEEAWREEINKIDNLDFFTFSSITNVFIYFNPKINLL